MCELIRRSPRVRQGTATSAEDVTTIREGIKEKKPICVSILNYTRNGKPFWNILAIQVRTALPPC